MAEELSLDIVGASKSMKINGIAMCIWGGLSLLVFLGANTQGLGAYWILMPIVFLVCGILSLTYKRPVMLFVDACVIVLVGFLNIVTSIGEKPDGFSIAVGIAQFVWAIADFNKYRMVLHSIAVHTAAASGVDQVHVPASPSGHGSEAAR
jgi:hypothetical protein